VSANKLNRRRGRLVRTLGSRPAYDRVLIACEGKKTEPLYLDDIRKKFRIPSAHLRVLHSEFGTQPRQVVDFAESKFLETREFDWVYAVFDRDIHTTYHDALARAAALDNKLKNTEKKLVRFIAVPSVPCFELWILLHYVNHQAFCDRHEMFQRVRQQIPTYDKGLQGIFSLTEANVATATARAEWLREQYGPHSGVDPYTGIDLLVAKLLSVRKRA
jgi:RloB-like protein